MKVNVFGKEIDVEDALVFLYEDNVQPFNEYIATYLAKTSEMTENNTADEIAKGIKDGIEEEVEAMNKASDIIEQYLSVT